MLQFHDLTNKTAGELYTALTECGVKVQLDPNRTDGLLVAGSPYQPLTPELTNLIKGSKKELLGYLQGATGRVRQAQNLHRFFLFTSLPTYPHYEVNEFVDLEDIYPSALCSLVRELESAGFHMKQTEEEGGKLCQQIVEARRKANNIYIYGKDVATVTPQSPLPAKLELHRQTLLRR